MDDERTSPAAVEALPLPARAEAYIAAQRLLETRLELPGT